MFNIYYTKVFRTKLVPSRFSRAQAFSRTPPAAPMQGALENLCHIYVHLRLGWEKHTFSEKLLWLEVRWSTFFCLCMFTCSIPCPISPSSTVTIAHTCLHTHAREVSLVTRFSTNRDQAGWEDPSKRRSQFSQFWMSLSLVGIHGFLCMLLVAQTRHDRPGEKRQKRAHQTPGAFIISLFYHHLHSLSHAFYARSLGLRVLMPKRCEATKLEAGSSFSQKPARHGTVLWNGCVGTPDSSVRQRTIFFILCILMT